eukprot:9486178-Pyramimonas_sp.AAC.1
MAWQQDDTPHEAVDYRYYNLGDDDGPSLQDSLLHDDELDGYERDDAEELSPGPNWFFTPTTAVRANSPIDDAWEREVMDEASLSQEEVLAVLIYKRSSNASPGISHQERTYLAS